MRPRTPTLRRRPARMIPSVLVCLAILIPAGCLLWAIVVRFIEGTWPEPIASGAPAVLATPLSDPGVIAAAVVLALLGAVLILCAVIPGSHRHSRLDVAGELRTGSQETVLTHTGTAHILRARTGRLDGVEAVTAGVTGRRAQLTVHTPLHETREVTDRVRAVAEDTLAGIPFTRPPAVSVRPGRSRR